MRHDTNEQNRIVKNTVNADLAKLPLRHCYELRHKRAGNQSPAATNWPYDGHKLKASRVYKPQTEEIDAIHWTAALSATYLLRDATCREVLDQGERE